MITQKEKALALRVELLQQYVMQLMTAVFTEDEWEELKKQRPPIKDKHLRQTFGLKD